MIAVEVAHGQFAVTPRGEKGFATLDIDMAALHTLKRQFAKRCPDWTERRYHVAGALGAAIAAAVRRRNWIVPVKGRRVVHVTADRYRGLRKVLGVTL